MTMADDLEYTAGLQTGGNVFHGFFTNRGGVSKGLYDSLNCGMGSNDDTAHVLENLNRVAGWVEVAPDDLLTLYQIHSPDCVVVTEPWARQDKPQADAYVTDRPGIGLGILTADCAPVLFYGEKANGDPVIGAAHAGWKGALGGVLQNTVSKMQELGCDLSGIRAAIGPCIAQISYEVDEAFYRKFCEASDLFEGFFKSGQRSGHYLFDLAGFCSYGLSVAGVRQVKILDQDTYTQPEKYYSYRRKTHKGEDDYGRQISVIAIRKATV